ncbi:type VI secretion system tip protein TssI/VgrG [Hahella sp. SMD15-11]|uniref:Type VI secretion system tip protein TssI/VgrG n=1 Tax=Thermohahella caldifontis TaxID=3142973 RepID=A0AB39UWW5_9GAMM
MELAANTARLTVRVARMDADLRVLSLTLSEALAELSHATLVIVSPEPLPGPEDWLSRDVHVSFRGRYGERHLHGAVNEAWRLQDIGRFQRMQITVVPHAWWLTERCRYRIFTETTAVDIARALWREAGLRQDDLVFDLRATPPVWQYRTQSGESEWDFLCRLFSELGWYWYFRHEADRHILMVSDHAGALMRPDGTRRHVAIHYDRQSGQSEILYRFQRVRRRALHQVRTRRYRMGTPLAIETGEARHDQASPSGLHEHYVHQEDAPDARRQAESWLNSLNTGCDHCIAQGNRADLNCGEVLSFRFPDDTRSDWLITGLTQQMAHPQVLEELASGSFRHYQTLTAVPDTQTWRPPRQTPRRLTGFWPAIVTGPAPGKVFTDDQGRVQVRFAWDPDGQPGTWLRVSQRLAGNRWGSLMLPRAGDEVSVLFLEGNPDTPVVAGRRYHSAHEAPQSLPDGQHQWMFRSRSANGTGHEVLLDDSPGNAHILLHSSGQLALRARKRYQASVQGCVHQKVAGHLQETTDGAASEQADGNWNEHVSGQTHLQAGQSLVLGGQSLTLEAGGSIHLKGGNALFNSGQTVIFKVGGAAVSCGPGGVSLSAPVVMVNMGGGGGAAATASPAAPEKSPAVPPERGALRTRLRPLAGQSGDAAHIQRLMPLTTGSGSAPATSRPEPPVPSAVLGASTSCQAPRQVQSGVNMSAIAPQSSSEDAKTFAHSLRYPPPATGNNNASPDPVSPGYVFTGELAVDALPEDARFELSTGDGKWTSVCTLERVRQYGRVYEIPFDGKPPYEPLHLYVCSDSMTSARHYLRTVIPDKNHRTTQDN